MPRPAPASVRLLVGLGLALVVAGCGDDPDPWREISAFAPGDPAFTASLRNLHFVIETTETAVVDSVFARLVADRGIPTTAVGCPDGIHVGESAPDAHGYVHRARLDVRGGRVEAVAYDEVGTDGRGKRGDPAYGRRMSVAGATPAAAFAAMEEDLVGKQDFMAVDGLTGATYSLHRFRYAVMLGRAQE